MITTLGTFPGANGTDTSKRIPAAISALNKALAGDGSALTYMRQQAVGSATAVGKLAFVRALAIYDEQKAPVPAVAPAPTQGIPVEPAPVSVIHPTLLPSPSFQPKPPIVSTITMDGPHAAPVGFAPVPPDMTHPPVVVHPGISVSGVVPGVITPVVVGSTGGVISGQPVADYSGPESAPAPANFGSAASTIDGTAGAVTQKSAAAATPSTSTSGKVVLLLLAGVILFALVDHKRK